MESYKNASSNLAPTTKTTATTAKNIMRGATTKRILCSMQLEWQQQSRSCANVLVFLEGQFTKRSLSPSLSYTVKWSESRLSLSLAPPLTRTHINESRLFGSANVGNKTK